MKYITCTITGVTPLLCNKFTDEAMMAATNGTSNSSRGAAKGTPREQCEKKLYIGLSGNLMIPQPNVMASIVAAGRFHKVGKRQVSTADKSMLFSCLDIQGNEIPIVHNEPWTIDTRAVRNPATKGRMGCHRPCFHDWSLTFSMELDDTILDSSLLRTIVDDAGKRVGLGDFRPDTKGPFGKYRVDSWVESNTP